MSGGQTEQRDSSPKNDSAAAAGTLYRTTSIARLLSNALICLAVAAILVMWFAQHIPPLVQMVPIGAVNLAMITALVSASLFAVARLRSILVDKETSEHWAHRIRRCLLDWLSCRRTTHILIAGCGVSLGIYFGTTSTFVINEMKNSNSSATVIRLPRDGHEVAIRMTATDPVKVQGVFNFPDLSWFEQRVIVDHPAGKRVMPHSVGWVRSVQFRIPADFLDKPMRVFRILPPPRLLAELPEKDGPATHAYELSIFVNDKQLQIGSRGLRRGSICFGSDTTADIRWFLGQESESDRNRAFADGLKGIPIADGGQIIDAWRDHFHIIEVPPFAVGSKLRVQVISKPTGQASKVIAQGRHEVTPAMTIQTISVEHVQ